MTDYKTEWMHNAALSDMEHHAEGIRYHTGRIISTPFTLAWQETFPTRMEAAIDRAINAAHMAIAELEKKRAEYRKLGRKEAA